MEGQSRFRPLRSGNYAVIDGPHKLVWHAADDSVELYDLLADPHELRDLAAARTDVTARLRGLLRSRFAVAEQARQVWMSGGR
jgi:hypothetical protein